MRKPVARMCAPTGIPARACAGPRALAYLLACNPKATEIRTAISGPAFIMFPCVTRMAGSDSDGRLARLLQSRSCRWTAGLPLWIPGAGVCGTRPCAALCVVLWEPMYKRGPVYCVCDERGIVDPWGGGVWNARVVQPCA